MTSHPIHQKAIDDHRHDLTLFGFWIYLMTDCILFACLFVTYVILHHNTNGGPTTHDLYNPPFVLSETLILLTSSFTIGLALLGMERKSKLGALGWLAATFLLGATFLGMELTEFTNLVQEGNGWTASAFLSSYFTLVGTHGAHITCGLIWILVMIAQIYFRGITASTFRRIGCLSLFWHFLDVVWIFIFTIVYLMGVLEHA